MRTQISNNKELGMFFREARRTKKISIERSAKLAGISHTTWRNMEKARGHIRSDILVAMAHIVGIKIEFSLE